MVDVGQLWVRLGFDASGFTQGINNAKNNLVGWRDNVNKSTADMMKWGAAIGATVAPFVAVGYAIENTIQKYGQMADMLGDVSYQTGITVEKLQHIQTAAMLSGTEFGSATAALNRLSLSMSAASDASSEQAKAFRELGISVDGRSTDEVFTDTAIALVKMEDTTRRNALAMDIYGRGYKEILPLMQVYVDKQAEIKAHPIYTDQELKELNDAKVELDRLGDSLTKYTGKAIAAEEKTRGFLSALNPLQWAIWAAQGKFAPQETLTIEQSLPTPYISQSVIDLTDRYAGLSDIQIDLNDATEALTKAQKEQADALKRGDVVAYDAASRSAQLYKNQIVELRTAMAELAPAQTAAQKSLFTSWDVSSVVGMQGGAMYEYMIAAEEAGLSYQDALNAWSAGAPLPWDTPGTAGYATKTATTAATDTTQQVEEAKELNTKQIELWTQLEADSLTHYAALAEMSRVRSQAEIDYMTACVNFAGENPIVQNKIIMSATGPDWEPAAFTPLESLTLATADFSKIKTLGGGASAGTGGDSGTTGEQSGAGTTAKTAEIVVNVNNPQGLSTPASIQQASKALASVLQRGSAT